MTPITWVETSCAGFYGLAFMRSAGSLLASLPYWFLTLLTATAAVFLNAKRCTIRFEARIFRHNAGRGDTGARHIRDKVHNAILMAYLVGELNRFATKREPIE